MTEMLQSSAAGYEGFVMTGDIILQVKSSPPSPGRKSRLVDSCSALAVASHTNVSAYTDGNSINSSNAHCESTTNNADCNSHNRVTSNFAEQMNNHNGNSPSYSEHLDDSSVSVPKSDDSSDASHDSTCSLSSDDLSADDITEENFSNGGVVYGSMRKVDEPSAHRLAKRLYNLDGFKRSDVAYHLTRDNQFSRKVNEEYLKYFDFTDMNLVEAMRKFFEHFALVGETQERERVLNHFTNRYLQCNPSTLNGVYNSQDACHTLTCAIMLLNTDLHGQNVGRRMTLNDFIENLSDLNNQDDFSKDMLKIYYTSIKLQELTWARDDDVSTAERQATNDVSSDINGYSGTSSTPVLIDQMATPQYSTLSHSFLTVPAHEHCTEYKRGVLKKKHCKGPDLKPVSSGKRGWKKHYVILKGMVLYLLKSSTAQIEDKTTKVILLHHSLAQVDRVYNRKPCVFSLQSADWSEYLFSTSNVEELESWVNTINLVSALLSAEPLAAGVGSQKKFHRPLLPSSHTKLGIDEQVKAHERRMLQLKQSMAEEESYRPDKSSSKLAISNYNEKMEYLKFELQRYVIYAHLLKDELDQQMKVAMNSLQPTIGEVDETLANSQQSLDGKAVASEQQASKQLFTTDKATNRYSYQQAIHNNLTTAT